MIWLDIYNNFAQLTERVFAEETFELPASTRGSSYGLDLIDDKTLQKIL